MEFKEWLNESEGNIKFAAWSKDGTIVVYINGVRYTYVTDAYDHDKWRRMVPYAPWRVLNAIKKSGQLVDQQIVSPSSRLPSV